MRNIFLFVFVATVHSTLGFDGPCGGLLESDAGEFKYLPEEILERGKVCVWIVKLISRQTVQFNLTQLGEGLTVSLYAEHNPSELSIEPTRLSSSDEGVSVRNFGQTLVVVLTQNGSGQRFAFAWDSSESTGSELLIAANYIGQESGQVLWNRFNNRERLTLSLNADQSHSLDVEANADFRDCSLVNHCQCSYLALYEITSDGYLREVSVACGRLSQVKVQNLFPNVLAFVYLNSSYSLNKDDFAEINWIVSGTDVPSTAASTTSHSTTSTSTATTTTTPISTTQLSTSTQLSTTTPKTYTTPAATTRIPTTTKRPTTTLGPTTTTKLTTTKPTTTSRATTTTTRPTTTTRATTTTRPTTTTRATTTTRPTTTTRATTTTRPTTTTRATTTTRPTTTTRATTTTRPNTTTRLATTTRPTTTARPTTTTRATITTRPTTTRPTTTRPTTTRPTTTRPTTTRPTTTRPTTTRPTTTRPTTTRPTTTRPTTTRPTTTRPTTTTTRPTTTNPPVHVYHGCGGTIKVGRGDTVIKYFPDGGYQNSEMCVWTLLPTTDYSGLSLNYTSYGMDNKLDGVIIHNWGEDGIITSTKMVNSSTTISFKKPYAAVMFSSDLSITGRGFQLTITGTGTVAGVFTYQSFGKFDEYLMSFSYPEIVGLQNYKPNERSTVLIQTDRFKNMRFSVDFTDIKDDSLLVYQLIPFYGGGNADLIGRLTGLNRVPSVNSSTWLPKLIIFNTNSNTNTGRGFTISLRRVG